MSMIDLKNLDKLSKDQREQFDALLDQFPHLNSKMESSRELNTPTKIENTEMDYSNFMGDDAYVPVSKSDLPKLNINENQSFLTSFDKKEENVQAQEKEEAQRVKAAVNAGQPREVATFSPEGKVHPILQKLRATVGLRSVQEPTVINIGGCDYSLKALDRNSAAHATVLAATTTNNAMLYDTNLETAIIAFSVVAIDGVPLFDIFSISQEVNGNKLTHMQREEKASEAFYVELLKSPNELVEALSIYYQQQFPSLNLLGEGRAKFLCPVGNCLQSRITEFDATCYCPVHGEKMAREDLLPNPL